MDLCTGELAAHEWEQLVRHCTPVEHTPDATHTDWDRALPDIDVQGYVRPRGTGATGVASDRVACVFKGGGSNGKTTIVNGVARALGSYAWVMA